MIIKEKLSGIGTKKNEIFGIFRSGGHSSKIIYDEHILETVKIRLNNNQSKLLVLIVTLYKYYKNIRLIKKKKKTLISIISLIYNLKISKVRR